MAKDKSDNICHVKRALLSVSDKSNLLPLANYLKQSNVQIISTGGTAKHLTQQDIPVTDVSSLTGFPEIMDGRVKTLHPKIAGAILGRRQTDQEVMQQHDILAIDLIVVNLYPFEKTIHDPNHTLSQAIENIDIGGPTMIRAAAKNYQDVAVIVDPEDYDFIIDELTEFGGIREQTRFELMQKAFAHTADYDQKINQYFSQYYSDVSHPEQLTLQFRKQQDLRYGENPHQSAALYAEMQTNQNKNANITNAKQIQGKSLSFNNLVDADTALECVNSFSDCACVIVKHANPCGVAVSTSQIEAYDKAFKTDPTSAFGGIIAFNQPVSTDVATEIIERQFVEVIIAPAFSDAALAIFAKKKNVRVLQVASNIDFNTTLDYKRISGGLLVQTHDYHPITAADLKVVTRKQPTETDIVDLLFTWNVAKFVKSNAIVYAKDGMTMGIGAGQMSRVYSAKIAEIKAQDEGLSVEGSVMASDAFFPFRDSIDAAANAGVRAIIQPGGSIRDEEVIAAADEHNLCMVFTGIRHFRH